MAVIWKKENKGRRFEVRSAGNSLRLYTNGVFNSQYNPKQLITHAVWDLLTIPAFIHYPTPLNRVLVLGVGGGTCFHQLDAWLNPKEIVGVELCKDHINIAKRFFSLNKKHHKVIHDDAIDFIKNYQGTKFDLIIEDLYVETQDHAERAILAEKTWLNALHKHLTPSGVLVMNFYGKADLDKSSALKQTSALKPFNSVLQLSTRNYENRVIALSKKPISPTQLRQNLQSHPNLIQVKSGRLKLDYHCRKVK